MSRSIEELTALLSGLADKLDAPQDGLDGKDGKDGRDGRDAQGIAGRDGRDGRDGKDGVDGKDAVGLPGLSGRPGTDGRDGRDGETGPMPRHEWRGTELRFELEDGQWGPWVNVRGARGANGSGGGPVSTANLALEGGGAFDSGTGLNGEFAATSFVGIPGVGGGGAATVYASSGFNAGRA